MEQRTETYYDRIRQEKTLGNDQKTRFVYVGTDGKCYEGTDGTVYTSKRKGVEKNA